MHIKANMKVSTKLTHENMSSGTKLIKLLKIHHKSLFNQKLLRVKAHYNGQKM
jgi:hypothetical protein